MDFSVVDRLVDAMNRHDLDDLVACFAEDMTGDWPAHPARSHVGADNVRRNWEMILARFPDIHVSITASAVSGDEHWGEWHYLRPGAPDMKGVIVIGVRDDRIARSRFYVEEVEHAAVAHPMKGVTVPAEG